VIHDDLRPLGDVHGQVAGEDVLLGLPSPPRPSEAEARHVVVRAVAGGAGRLHLRRVVEDDVVPGLGLEGLGRLHVDVGGHDLVGHVQTSWLEPGSMSCRSASPLESVGRRIARLQIGQTLDPVRRRRGRALTAAATYCEREERHDRDVRMTMETSEGGHSTGFRRGAPFLFVRNIAVRTSLDSLLYDAIREVVRSLVGLDPKRDVDRGGPPVSRMIRSGDWPTRSFLPLSSGDAPKVCPHGLSLRDDPDLLGLGVREQ